ncbi:MAG: ABC transporter substrate-binding protein [Paracoccaceae bacterium]
MDRRTLLQSTAGFAALGLAAPMIARAQTAVELSVTHCFPGHDGFHTEIANAFMAANPDVKILFNTSPPTYEEGHSLILRQAMTNQLPDIYYSGFHLLPPLSRQLTERGQITHLDSFIATEGDAWKTENYSQRILDLANIDDKQMAMPFNTSTPIFYFNEELVKQAGGDPENFPTTWDGVFELATKIDALGDDIDGFFMAIHTEAGDWFWQALVYSNGGELMDAAEQTVAFGDDKGLAALTLTKRFVDDAKMNLRETQQGVQQFYAGKTGILVQSTASLRGTTDSVGTNFTLRTARYPLADATNGRLPTGGNAQVILTTDAAKLDAAWRFSKWVSGPEGQTVAVKFSGYMPTSLISEQEQYLGAFYKENPNYTTSVGQIPVARKWFGYPGKNSNKIIDIQRENINLAMRGEMPVADVLAKMVTDTQGLI